jgi:hypothetical protein
MPALVAGTHVFLAGFQRKDVDGRDKPGHDSGSGYFVVFRYACDAASSLTGVTLSGSMRTIT